MEMMPMSRRATLTAALLIALSPACIFGDSTPPNEQEDNNGTVDVGGMDAGGSDMRSEVRDMTTDPPDVAPPDGGVPMPDMSGGYGVAESVAAAAERLGLAPQDTRAVVQGFGSMGGSTARYLVRNGIRVVGAVDAKGVIFNPEGVDVERLLRTRSAYGELDRSVLGPGDEELPLSEWLSVEAEVLVPAAISYARDAENCDEVNARIISEAANVPVTADAERRLLARGIPVIPDFIANAGAVGWAWWTLFGDITPEPEDAFEKLSVEMRRAVGEILEAWESGASSPREAAKELSQRNLDEFADLYGEASSTRSIL